MPGAVLVVNPDAGAEVHGQAGGEIPPDDHAGHIILVIHSVPGCVVIVQTTATAEIHHQVAVPVYEIGRDGKIPFIDRMVNGRCHDGAIKFKANGMRTTD